MPNPWSQSEVEATVADYLHMWLLEQAGQSYNKTTHRKALLRKLNDRTEGAIEMKHQNISAILMEHGWQNIPGYKPRGNYQALLAEVVADRIMRDRQFDLAAEGAADQQAIVPLVTSITDVMVERPRVQPSAQQQRAPYFATGKPQLKRDYLDREARNRSLAHSARRGRRLWCCSSSGGYMRRGRRHSPIRSNTPLSCAAMGLGLTWRRSRSMVRRDSLK